MTDEKRIETLLAALEKSNELLRDLLMMIPSEMQDNQDVQLIRAKRFGLQRFIEIERDRLNSEKAPKS